MDFSGFASAAFASYLALTPQGSIESQTKEKTLLLNYRVECTNDDAGAFPGVTGSVHVQGRTIRFDLFKYNTQTEVSLGAVDNSVGVQDLSFQFDTSKSCRLISMLPDIGTELWREGDEERTLALLHSPFIVVRDDQYDNRTMDNIIGANYTIKHPSPRVTRITYTHIFSNETVHGLFSTSKPKSLGAYGRRTDIEWTYQVDIDSQGNAFNQKYQGGVVWGIGHKVKDFKGKYIPNTQHPILYDCATHNVFSDEPSDTQDLKGLVGYHVVPREEMLAPESREWWMWRRPWTFDVSDRELRRTNELKGTSAEMLYALIDGETIQGYIIPTFVNAKTNKEMLAGDTTSSATNSMGDDMWGEQYFSALPMGQDFMDNIKVSKGAFFIRPYSFKYSKENIDFKVRRGFRFFKLIPDASMGFKPEEITNYFKCGDGDSQSYAKCSLN